MAKYEPGDIVTFYFIIKDEGKYSHIKGWTDNKKLANFYLQFHHSPSLRIKSVTKRIEEMNGMINENIHDEIVIANLYTRDGRESKMVIIPATTNELTLIRDECSTFFSGRVNYHWMDIWYRFFKNKYVKALDKLFLDNVIKFALHNKMDHITSQIDIDQIRILLRIFQEDFG